MTSFQPIFDGDELAELCLGAKDRIERAIGAGDRAKASACVTEIAAAKRGFCESYLDWLTLTDEYLLEELGTAEHRRAAAPERRAELAERSGLDLDDLVAAQGLIAGHESAPEERVRRALASDDRDGAIVAWSECERLFRAVHDLRRDLVSDLLGWIYAEHGAVALVNAQLYAAERGPWGQWFPAERGMPPKERLEGFTHLMCVGSFSEIEIVEEQDRWIVRMNMCGTCARQVRDRYETDAFQLATVDGPGPATMAKPALTVYQTHLAIIHRIWAIGAVGAPWPGPIECAGLEAGRRPCEVILYKDPVETPARFFEVVQMAKPRA